MTHVPAHPRSAVRLATWAVVLLGILGLVAPAHAQDRPSADLDAQIARFGKTTGVRLIPVLDPADPTLTRRRGGEYGPVDPHDVQRALPILQDVLMKYPTLMRGGLLQELYLFGKLRFRGKPFLGAARPAAKRFDLAVRPRTPELQMRSTIHHELSHLIEHHPRFPHQRWTDLSGRYAGSLRHQADTQSVQSYLDQGFISRYASKNRHEDFAELAERVWTQPRRTVGLARQHPALYDKLVLLTLVYQRIAPDAELPWVDRTLQADVDRRPPLGPAPKTRQLDDKGNRIVG